MNAQVARGHFIKKLTPIMLKIGDLDNFLNSLTEMMAEVFAAGWATLSLLDETTGQYVFKASSRREQSGSPDELLGVDSSGSWLKERQKILSQRLLDEFGPQMAPELKDQLYKTEVSMPLFAGDKLIGVLNLGARVDGGEFAKEDLESLGELAGLLAAIINQAVEHDNLSEQKLHHQNILDNLVSAIVAVGPEGKITVFNRAAERILKFKAEQMLGKDVRKLQANLANLLLDTLHKGKSVRRQELYILPQNTLIGVSTSQFYDAKGKLLGACMVFSSIAEIKKKERLTRQQNLNTYWSNVANSLAHEVKNSIVATKVFTEMFPKKYEDAEFRWNLYSTLKRDMEKLDNFTEKVLNFAQAQEIASQPYGIDKVMNMAIEAALQNRDIGEVTFEKRYSQQLPSLSGDYHQLKEAFAQIISNALEAMGKIGRLSISIDRESGPEMLTYNLPQAVAELPKGEIVVVKISDTGCGIPAEHLANLFDPFFTTKDGRSGLGLAFARKIVERHSGIIRVESKQGEGSTVWVCLPVS